MPRDLDVLLGHLLIKRIPVMYKLSSTKIPEYLSQSRYKDVNKRPMGLDALLQNQLGHLPKFQKLHIYSISTSGVEIELIFTL